MGRNFVVSYWFQISVDAILSNGYKDKANFTSYYHIGISKKTENTARMLLKQGRSDCLFSFNIITTEFLVLRYPLTTSE